jgi:NAD(P)H-hydrate epimerase
MHDLSDRLYRAEHVRQLDRIAIDEFGIPGNELMARAGRGAFEELRRRWPGARRVAVLSGAGNNGGDGYVVARLARSAGLQVQVFATTPPAQLRGEAAVAAQEALETGVDVQGLPAALTEYDLVVDAVLGSGTRGAPTGAAHAAIALMNASGVPVFALDLPSGLDPDTGHVPGEAVHAAATLCFIGLKAGLFTAQGPDCAGAVLLDDLDVPAAVYQRVSPAAQRMHEVAEWGPRTRSAHKGDFGHVLVIGGDLGMGGAVRMAGEAALRVGAGLVSIATRPEHAAAITAARPELMVHGVNGAAALAPLLARASVVAVGCGLGTGEWGRTLLGKVLDSAQPKIVDADALNLLAMEPERRDDWVLTPHPGEAARLLGCSGADIQKDRFQAAAEIATRFGGTLVLKGAGTVVHAPGDCPAVCTGGNPGMASGGMGDVLTGVIAGLVAQGFTLPAAARAGVCLHACAADAAARDGERGLLATDLLPHLRRLVNS